MLHQSFFYIFIGISLCSGIGTFILIRKYYRTVSNNSAYIRFGLGGTQIFFRNFFCMPYIHACHEIDLTPKRIKYVREHETGLVCKDFIRIDLRVSFLVSINPSVENVLKVYNSGSAFLSTTPHGLNSFFEARFVETLKTVAHEFEFSQLFQNQDVFKKRCLKGLVQNCMVGV